MIETRKYIAIALMMLFSTAASATLVWDETVDGDAGVGTTAGAGLGTLSNGTWDVVNASLDGGDAVTSGSDEFDDFYFNATNSWTVDLSFLNLISTTGLVTIQLLGDGTIPSGYAVGFDTTASNDIFNGAIGAGSWGLRFIPLGNTGQLDYEFSINVGGDIIGVPAPPVALVMLLGMALLGLRKRA